MKPEIEWREESETEIVGYLGSHQIGYICVYIYGEDEPADINAQFSMSGYFDGYFSDNEKFQTISTAKAWIEKLYKDWKTETGLTHIPPGYVLVPEEPTKKMIEKMAHTVWKGLSLSVGFTEDFGFSPEDYQKYIPEKHNQNYRMMSQLIYKVMIGAAHE